MRLCPICESAGNAEFFAKDDRWLLICRNCRHVWWRDLPTEMELATYYRSHYTGAHSQEEKQSKNREYYRSHLGELLAVLGHGPRETALLDYGCSIPVLAHEAVKLSFRKALGVDWADEVKQCGGKWGVEILTPPELASIPDRSLDIARFSHTIEHSIDPLATLRTVLPKMRTGGLIYITQPNFPVLRARQSGQDLADTVYPEHLHFFSALSLVEMVCRLNLQIIRFFSHQNADEVVSRFQQVLDLDYARERLMAYADRGDAFFPACANYPYYAGENSVMYALVRG